MSRRQTNTVEYFPHYADASDGDTLTILEGRWGNDGYTFWFKLLQKLAASENHYIDCKLQVKWQLLLAKSRLLQEVGEEIMETLADLGAIDAELWRKHRVIWCENLVNNVADVYKNRRRPLPQKPIITSSNEITTPDNAITTDNLPVENPQSKVKESKGNQSKEKKIATTTLLGFEVEQKWYDDLVAEYPQLDIRFEEKRCYDWWTGQRKTIKNAKNAMRNWCINEAKFKAEKAAQGTAARKPGELPNGKELKEAWNT